MINFKAGTTERIAKHSQTNNKYYFEAKIIFLLNLQVLSYSDIL